MASRGPSYRLGEPEGGVPCFRGLIWALVIVSRKYGSLRVPADPHYFFVSRVVFSGRDMLGLPEAQLFVLKVLGCFGAVSIAGGK